MRPIGLQKPTPATPPGRPGRVLARGSRNTEDNGGVTSSYLDRFVADSTDRVSWLRARSRGITATDVAKLSTPRSIETAAEAKLNGTGFTGNAFTDHGRRREPEIAAWVAATHGIQPSSSLYHAAVERRHLATPDGVTTTPDGVVILSEIKTTTKPWRSVPRNYLRQIFWQQYVLGAERTLVVWEEHRNFVPVGEEPLCRWIDRDEAEIGKLVGLANDLINELHRRTTAPAPRTESAPDPFYY